MLLFGSPALARLPAADTVPDLTEQLRACTHCHGLAGRAGPDGYYPRIAGKPAGYLYAQLLHFRDGRRRYDLMQRLLAPLSDDYLAEIAVHFSRQQPPFPAPARQALNASDAAQARSLVERGDTGRELTGCAQCHGTDLMGQPPAVPGLLGLPRDYLSAQLGAWRADQRHSFAPDCMAEISKKLTVQEISALSAWLSSQSASQGPIAASIGRTQNQSVDCSRIPAGPAATAEGTGATAKMPTTRATAAASSPTMNAHQQRGEYLARIGNCAGCHSLPGGPPLAGGRAITTPFGDVYATNLTPDVTTGLGRWQSEDFWQALRAGRSRDGRLLYPVFPYAHYSGMSRDDADALFAWLRTVPPVARAAMPNQLVWPSSTQWALRLWRSLYFKPFDSSPDASRSPSWNRGRYLVETVGHCGACHTPRNRFGAPDERLSLTGARMPEVGWYAPALRAGTADPAPISERRALTRLLTEGQAGPHRMSGPMAVIVADSLRHLTPADRDAMSEYLESIARPLAAGPAQSQPASGQSQPASAQPPPATAQSAQASASATTLAAKPSGAVAQRYADHCADCHGRQGEGARGEELPLAGNRTVLLADPSNAINAVLYGGFGTSATASGLRRSHGMPPFVLTLDDREIAELLTWVRSSWGNRAAPVSEHDVRRQRGIKAH